MTAHKRPTHNCLSKPHGAWYSRGVSLIEILVTVLVLAIGLLGLAGLQGTSLRNSQSAYARTQATHLAYEITDAMRANITAARNGAYNIAYAGAPAGGGIAEADLTAWVNRITTLLPAGQGQITQNGDTFTISVRWDDSRGVEAVQEFQVVTQL